MLNYNKSFRESSGKSARKSIYSGNKLHTTSMNLRNEASNDCIGLPLKEIIYNKKEEDKSKAAKKGRPNPNRTQEYALRKSVNPSAKVHKHYQETARILETERFNRETGTYRRSIEIFRPKHQRLKTDINEEIKESASKLNLNLQINRCDYSPSPYKKHLDTDHNIRSGYAMVEVRTDELKNLLSCIRGLKKDKLQLLDEIQFMKKSRYKESSSANAVMKALAA